MVQTSKVPLLLQIHFEVQLHGANAASGFSAMVFCQLELYGTLFDMPDDVKPLMWSTERRLALKALRNSSKPNASV